MSVFSRTSLSLIGLVLMSMSTGATAQVTLQMTTTASANCTATTDANGLSLVPGSTDLSATGVTLSGPGCGSGAADFETTLDVPGSTQAGTGVTVNWSAGPDATQCTYGGSAGLGGWPIGSSACSGGACAGAHQTTVTPSAAGNYNLSITCTNATGFKQDTLSATAPPDAPQPPNFVLTAPATADVNTPFNVSWSVTGATSCTGSASLNGSSVNLGGWNTVTSASSPRTVTATQAGTYTLNLACSNTVGTTNSQPRIVTVSGGGTDSCPTTPLTRLTTANIKYPNVPPSSATRMNVDVRVFDNIWGHSSTVDTSVPWPGRNSSVPAILGWGKTQYVAAKFTVPLTGVGTLYETLRYSTYFSGPALTMAVSQTCGDFAPSNPNCLTVGVGTGDQFKKLVVAPYANGCPLVPGATYFINMKMTSPVQADCNGANSCTLATNNQLGTQP